MNPTLYTIVERDEFGMWWAQLTTANLNEANAFLTRQVELGYGDPVTHYRCLAHPEGAIEATVSKWNRIALEGTPPGGITYSEEELNVLLS